MKTKIYSFIFSLIAFIVHPIFGHDMRAIENAATHWETIDNKEHIGHFFLLKDNTLYVENSEGKIQLIPIDKLIPSQRKLALQKQQQIDLINRQFTQNASAMAMPKNETSPSSKIVVLLVFTMVMIGVYAWNKSKISFSKTWPLVTLSALLFMGFRYVSHAKYASSTRVSWMDSAFAYFKPNINTRSDATYYYVESLGLPDHETMLGITGWQQQVPIPQCYIGSNAWSIPLNPVIATQPVPVNNKHFLRGAVAIAVNGIPIFNPYTNTGVDAYLDGQLDQYGGHSGRADDYHYHIAPAVLYNIIPTNSPIAFALDGFAIYGSKEPDNSAMNALDTNHGHFWKDGVYHYHTSTSAPYMIKNMVGKVTEDTTLQIIPQAAAKGVRPALTPLKGAVITHNIMNSSKNGFTLSYTLGSAKDTVRYSWTPQGAYTYEFITNTGKTTSNYKGQPICTLPAASTKNMNFTTLKVFAMNNSVHVQLPAESVAKIQKMEIVDSYGKTLYSSPQFTSEIELKSLPTGIYYLRLYMGNLPQTTKFFAY